MARCVIIPVEGELYERDLTGYEDYKRELGGGYLEMVPGAADNTALYVDEDGISKGLARNPRASQLVRLFPGDYIKGLAILFGTGRIGIDGEEADCPLTLEQVEALVSQTTPDFGGGKTA